MTFRDRGSTRDGGGPYRRQGRLSRLRRGVMAAGAGALLFSFGCVQRDVISVTVALVAVQPGTASLLEGEQLQFVATVQDADGRTYSQAAVTWSVLEPEYLAIGPAGMANALLAGTTTVQASFRGVTGFATVTIIAAPVIELTPDSAVFRGAAGAASPPSQVVDVRNGGGGTLAGLVANVVYGAGQPTGWLTLTLGDTRAPTSLTLTPETAGLAVGRHDAVVTVASPDDRMSPKVVTVTLSLTGISVTETAGSTQVTEAGGSDSLTVVLEGPPTSDVVLNVTSADPSEVTASPATLTFTTVDWASPQLVVLTGQDELVADGDQVIDVALSVDPDLSDDDFDPIPDILVPVTNQDDDTPSYSVAETGGGTTVTEAGSTDQFTVVLDVEPISPVVFDVTGGDPSEASFAPARLTFTPADWATPQSVTVTGVDDDLIDGAQVSPVRIAIDPIATDDAFDALAPDSVLVTTTDDDVAGFTVTETLVSGEDPTQVTEAGGTDQITVVLDAQPVADVGVTVTSGDTGEVTVGPAIVIFTTNSWDTPVTVTLTGVDDALIDGNQSTPVSVGIDDASSDAAFASLPDFVVAATTVDDDNAGFTMTPSGGSTTVAESGTTDDFTVALGAQPTSDVVFDITSGNLGEVTVAPPTLTFTPATWNVPQGVTLTGVDELIDDGDQLTAIQVVVNAAASDNAFDAMPPDSIVVTTTDDDTAGFVITVTGGGTLVSETGTTDDFTVVLTSEPVDDVVVTLLASDASEASVSPASLTFTFADWNVPQTVTVTGVDDIIDDGDQFSVIAVGISDALSDAAYDPLPDQTVQVTTTDNDSPSGFTITVIGGTNVTEAGSTDDFTVRLDTQPASQVVFDISSGDVGEATVAPATLTFTPADWDIPQAVTVTGVDDNLIDGPQATVVTVSVNDAASDDNFDVLADQTVNVTTSDDDVAGFTIVESGGSTLVGEGGSTDDFTVVLTAQPSTPVELSVTSGDLGEATVAPTPLTFTGANWNTPQVVTVTGVDDALLDGGQVTVVTVAVVAANSDDDFDPVADQTVSVTTTDNDQPGVTASESSGSTVVSESGSTDSFTIVLDAQPASDVVLDLVSQDLGEVTVSPTTLTFTSVDWATPQGVVVTGVDDPALDGDIVTAITVAVNDGSSDDEYDPVPDLNVLVTTTDDDGAGFTVVESGGSTTVAEAGGTDDFTVVLDAQPSSAVVLLVSSDDTGEATVNPVSITFQPVDWNNPRQVTVTGGNDALLDGNQVSTITISVDGPGSDDLYDPVPPQTVLATTLDDDVASFTVTETGGGTLVSESATQDFFTVVLGAQPLTNVVFAISSSDTGEAVVTPSTLTFTGANWNSPQTVTVTGVNDAMIDGNQSSTILISVVDNSSDDDFDPLPDQTITVTTTDNDAAALTVSESGGGTSVTEAGSTDQITVVLTSQPTSDVVLDISSGDVGEVTVAPAQLTFTNANWGTAQTVTVTGVDELIDDGDRVTLVTIAVNDPLSDDTYDLVADFDVSVTTIDDDAAGFTISETGGGTLVTEAGSTDNFTVVLHTEPVFNVVFDITSGDSGEAAVAPVSLTFTPANWFTPQTVTVTGVDDLLDDDSQFTLIMVAVNDASSDDAFDDLPDQSVTVTTTDDDEPAGFTVTAIGGTNVTEAGGTDNFTVVLDAQPGSNVVLTVVSGDLTEVAVNPGTLTFSPANWLTPQTVTVTGQDDDIIDGPVISVITIAVDDVNSFDAYDPVPDQTLSVTTTDDDVAGFTVTETGGSTIVNESGTTDRVIVVLEAQPLTNVVIDVSSGNPAEATVSPTTLTFTPGNWNTPDTIIVMGIDDALIDGAQITTITLSVNGAASDNDFDPLPDQTVSVTTTDDDQPGITVTPSGGSTIVSEAGSTDDFTVVLDRGPASNVVVTITSGDLGEASVAPSSLTFTSVNWGTPQTVTVTGVDDLAADGDQITAITVAVDDANSDDVYDPVPDELLSVTTTDDDGADFLIVESGGSTSVTEAGSSDDFTVVLASQPATSVSLTVSSDDLGEATATPATLTFTNANWATPQTVFVTGVDDALIDGPQLSLITVSVDDSSSDDTYDPLPDKTVSVTTDDDDVAGFNISETGGGTLVTEAGGTDVFSVVLQAQPASDVVLDVSSGDTGEATVAPASVTFTPANWNTPQNVTVTGVDDAIIDGSQLTQATVAVNAALSDNDFDLVPAQNVSVTTTDDDTGGFTVTESAGSTVVNEAGATDDLSVVLEAQPLSPVVFDVSSSDLGEATVGPTTLTFTSANWNVAQTITVTGVDDLIDDGDQITSVTVSVNDAASDDQFDPAPDDVVSVTTVDDDGAGFVVVQSGGGTLVTESGSTDDFTVVLDTEPLSDVVITVVSGDPGEATVTPPSLTFTPIDWNVPQTVTVTGVDDLVDDGSQFTLITLAVDDAASDDAYDPVLDRTVTVTTTDDDAPVGFTITAIGGTSVTEAGSTDDFTVVLDAQPAGDVVLLVASGDPGEATALPASLTFTPVDWASPQTVTVTGVDDALLDGPQVTLVTVSVDDANSDDAYDALPDQTVSVTTTDDDVAGFTVVESGGSTLVSESGTSDDFTVVLDAQPLIDVVFTVTSGNTAEATVTPSTLTFTNATWNTPQTATVTGVDDVLIDGSQVSVVTVSVNAGASDNDFDPLPDATVNVTTTDDDAPGISIAESGGTTTVDESGTTDEFTVVLDRQPLLDVVLDLSSADTGEVTIVPTTLTFTSANWNTPQIVTATGQDDALNDGDQVTTVTVSVNDGASDDAYDPLPDPTVSVTTTDDDAAGFSVTESGGSTSVNESGTTDDISVVLDAQPASNVVFNVSSSDLGEVTVAPATITFTNANWNIAQTLTVTGVDDALIDGTQITLVTIAVDDLLSDPAYGVLPDPTVNVATQDDDVAGTILVESGGGTLVTEGGSTDDFTVVLTSQPIFDVVIDVTSGDLGEATVAPAQLTFTTADWDTPQTVTVTGVDDAIIDGSQLTLATVSVDDDLSDDAFDGVADQTVSVTTTDDDGAGFTVTESGGGTSVTEAGGTDAFSVVLDAQPGSNVVINVTSSDTGEATVSASTLTFTPANWATPQTVTVTGVDELIDDGDRMSTVTISVDDPNSDDNFDPLADQTVTVTTIDDDSAGFTITESGGTTVVDESGTTDDFTVVLDTEPVSDVVLSVTSSDVTEVTVSPATLTFTTADWNTAQTVTVTGVDDPINDGNQFPQVVVGVIDGPSDDAFDPLPDQQVDVTTTDNDLAGFTIIQTGGGTSVNESGTTDDFTVVLTAQPQTSVVLTVTSSDLSEVTVSPAALTFTNANWNTPQTVTVTGVDDAFDDGDRFTLVTVSVDDANSDEAFDPLADQTVSVTTIDDDGAGFLIVESGGGTSVDESGTSDSFDVVLTAQPTLDVVLDVSSADTGEVTVGAATLTFTSSDWDTPRTVTLTGVDDIAVDGNVLTLVTLSVDDDLSDAAYDPVPDQSVGVTTVDDDTAGFTIAESGGTAVTEAGSTDQFTVVLDAQPVSDVFFSVVSADVGEATVSPAMLTFTSVNWSVPQPVTVTGVDDEIDDGDQVTNVTVAVIDGSSDDAFDPLADQTVAVTTSDDDLAGFLVAEGGGSTSVSESGTTDDFTVTLTTQPTSNVVLSVTSADTGEATVNVTTLTFTPVNWSTPQTVIVTGANDFIDDGDQVTLITIAVVDGSSDDTFDPLPDQTVSVTTTDDDTAGFTLVESGGSTTVSESGTTDSFTVVLDTEPTSNVLITVTSLDTGEATVAPATLTFTTGNWNAPQTVTVTGVDDALVEGDIVTSLVVAVDDANSDDVYDPLPDQSVSVTTTDDDAAGFSVTETGGGTTVTEAGGTDTFDVVLTVQPISDVVFDVTSADTGEVMVGPALLTFTNTNWATPQTVTVTGVDDVTTDGPQSTAVTVAVNAAGSDDAFDALPPQTVDVTTTDDDAASFNVVESGGSTSVDESGSTDDISVVLGAQPTTDVVLTAVSQDTDEVTISPAFRTFTPANWDTPQDFTVTGVDDVIVDGSQLTLVTIAVDDANSDDAFDPLADQSVNVTTTDDDLPGFSLVQSGGTTVVDEAGSTDDFTVVLDRQPLTNVVFDILSADTGEVTVSTSLMTFTPANWNVPQTVTVTGIDDDEDDGDQSTQATVSVNAANSDDAFDLLSPQGVAVTTTDDDTAGFTVVESGGSTNVNESGTTDDFTVVLDAQPTSTVVIDVSSADTEEATVTPASLSFTPADWDTPQTVTVTGADDSLIDGPAVTLVTLSINDASSDNTFDPVPDQTVSVTTTDNDAPGFTVVETGATTVNESGTTDNFTVVLDAEPASDVVITVTSSNTNEATVAPSPLTFTPSDWSVPQTVTVTGVDDAIDDGDQISTVTLSIDDANSDNAFDPLADQTVVVTTIDNDGAGFSVAESGGGTVVSESGTTDAFTVVLSTQPATDVVITVTSGDTGEATVDKATLTFTNGNWSTLQTVTVTGIDDLIDDGNQFTSVTLAVDDDNSDNAFDPLPDQIVTVTTTDDDIAGFTIAQSGGGTLVSETGTTDTITVTLTAEPVSEVVLTVTSEDTGEVAVSPATLTFTNSDWNLPQTVTVTGVDDLLVDGFQFTTVTVAVDDANSDDAYDPLADQQVSVTTTDDDAADFVVAESGGGTTVDESGTTDNFTVVLAAQPFGNVVFDVTSNDTGEATVSPASLSFNNSNWNTPKAVTVTGIDDFLVDGLQVATITIAVNAAATEASFDGMSDQFVAASVTDNDAAGFTIVESGGTTSVTEAGSTDGFTVVLDAQPTLSVVIDITNPDPGEATVSAASLTFTSVTWNTPQSVTVTGVDDFNDDGDQVTALLLSVNAGSSDDAFDAVADQTVNVTTTDDDGAGFIVTPSGGSTDVTEASSTDDFTVVLTAQPLTDVVIDVTSADTGEATVDFATLTFTNANWNVARTVTVTGQNDDIDDGDQSTAITVSIDVGNSDAAFATVPAQNVNVTTTDDDVASFTIVESGGTSVDESGTMDTFTVVIGSQPVTAVVIDLTSGDTGEVSVSPAQLTFLPGTWATPQAVTVTGVDDGSLVDGDVVTNVTVSVNDAASDAVYDPLSDQSVSVTTTDDDLAGFSVVESGATVVTEAGGTDDFTVVLTGRPETNVLIDITSADAGEATVSPGQLTFTNANWNTAQTVTVTGVDDAGLLDGDQTTTLTISINDIGSNDAFDGLVDQTVIATTLDDEVAGFTVTDGGVTTVNESGTTDNFTVELDVQPTSDVTIDVSSGDTGEATVVPSTLIFTNGNWNTPQVVTVTGVGDAVADGDQVTPVTISIDPANSYDPFDALPDQFVSVTTIDADPADFVIVESDGTTIVDESGATDGFTVALTSQPLSSVVLDVASGNTAEATVSTASLTFTTANWAVPQPVTVTGVDDGSLVDGSQVTLVTVSVNVGLSDDVFDGAADQNVSVTTTDNDVAAFTVSETVATSVTEDGAGNTDDFTVVLDARPVSNVVILVSSGSPGEATAAPTSLTFTTVDWATAQTVTVTGVDDSPLVDGDQVSSITLSVDDANSDNAWDALGDQVVSVTTVDTDAAGFSVVESGGSTPVTEAAGAGNTDDFTVVLTAQPDGTVVFDISSSDATEATALPATLTFTNADWNLPQTVTVTGIDDDIIDGPQNSTITVAINQAGTTPLFDALPSQQVTVLTIDDDVAGFTVVESGGTAVTEAAGASRTDTFTVVLDAQPGSDVVISVTRGNTNEITAVPTPLTFTSANWDTPQTVTITGVDDDIDDGNTVVVVTMSVVDNSSDDDFDPLADQIVTVTVVDDDTAGFTIVESGGGTSVTEASGGGNTDDFTVVLNSEPTSNVVLSITPSDVTEATSSPAALTFTSADWDTPKTVTVTGVDDPFADGDVVSTITISVDDANSDNVYDPLPDQQVSVTTTDDEVAGFTVTEVGSETVTTEQFQEVQGIDVVLTAQPETDVVFTITDNDLDDSEIVINQTTLTFTTSNWDTSQRITLNGLDDSDPDGDQDTTITIAVDAGQSPAPFGALPAQFVVATTEDDETQQ